MSLRWPIRQDIRQDLRRSMRRVYFNVAQLFANGEEGAYYNPSILSSLYQDAAGTTPVTADSDPVGLILDLHESDGRGVVNLFKFTQEFGNAFWTASRASVSADATTAPDGSSTADKVIEDATAANSHRIFEISTGGLTAGHVFSIYVKAAERDWIYLRTRAGGGYRSAWFDLTNGVVGTVESGLTALIGSSGNGWYRCSIITPASDLDVPSMLIGLAVADDETNYNGDGSSGLFVWGAQVEIGATATAYQPNTATVGGPGNHASQSVADSRPLYDLDGNGNAFINHDAIDDQLVTVFPDLGTDATVAYSTSGGTTILTGQTISGSYNLPTDDWYGLIVLDRAFTGAETTQVTNFLNQLAGV